MRTSADHKHRSTRARVTTTPPARKSKVLHQDQIVIILKNYFLIIRISIIQDVSTRWCLDEMPEWCLIIRLEDRMVLQLVLTFLCLCPFIKFISSFSLLLKRHKFKGRPTQSVMFIVFINLHKPHSDVGPRSRVTGFLWFLWFPTRWRLSSALCLVGGQDLVDPTAELGDASVDGGSGGGATAASPGHDPDQRPGVVLLTHQGTAGVALQHNTQVNNKPSQQRTTSDTQQDEERTNETSTGIWVERVRQVGQVCGRGLTMQEVAPAPPAQIMTSEMLLPQWFLHCSLDIRGRAACWSRLGVLAAVDTGNTQKSSAPFKAKVSEVEKMHWSH